MSFSARMWQTTPARSTELLPTPLGPKSTHQRLAWALSEISSMSLLRPKKYARSASVYGTSPWYGESVASAAERSESSCVVMGRRSGSLALAVLLIFSANSPRSRSNMTDLPPLPGFLLEWVGVGHDGPVHVPGSVLPDPVQHDPEFQSRRL